MALEMYVNRLARPLSRSLPLTTFFEVIPAGTWRESSSSTTYWSESV